MSIEDKVAQAEKLIAEVKAELAEKASKARNWPEKIEAGMCFERDGGAIYMAMKEDRLVCIKPSRFNTIETIGSTWTSGRGDFSALDRSQWSYLGCDILAIRTDAHEPTGAELVGKVCEVSGDGVNWRKTFSGHPIVIEDFDGADGDRFKVKFAGWYEYARLAR